MTVKLGTASACSSLQITARATARNPRANTQSVTPRRPAFLADAYPFSFASLSTCAVAPISAYRRRAASISRCAASASPRRRAK